MVDQMGGGLRHAPCVARGTHSTAFAGEGNQEIVPAIAVGGAGEGVGEDAAVQIAAKLRLHVERGTLALAFLRQREVGLQVARNAAEKAKQSLSEMMYGEREAVDWYKLDKWGGKVSVAKVNDLDVCLEPIRRGLAVHFKKCVLGDALIEKPNHLARSIRALRIHMRAARAPAKPRVAAFMHQPVFDHSASRRITVDGAGVRVPTWHLTAFGRCSCAQ